MEKLELVKYKTKKDLLETYSFPVGKNEEVGSVWFMTPLEGQIAEFKNGLGKIIYFKTQSRDLNEIPYIEELEELENRKPIMYEMITDYVLLSEMIHPDDCECGCAEENRASLLKLDGFDDCYLGVAESYGELPALVYDQQKILENLQSDGMSLEESQEFYDFNILGSYLGEKMPIFLNRIPLDELRES
jgi:hypothetical protein